MSDLRDLVIIANEDQAVRDALQFALRLEGLCVHVHSGGASLLADPDLNRARCVILDERMRQMDGFALIGHLHARNITLPTIMLTSHATQRVRESADAAGVRMVLEKPLLEDVLMENIRSILSLCG